MDGSSLRRRRVGRSDLATEETELEVLEVEPSSGRLLWLWWWWWWWRWRLAEDDVVVVAEVEWRKGSLKKFQTLGSEWGLGSATAMLSSSPVPETVIAQEMNWRSKRIDFELRDDRGRGSKRRRLLRLLLFSGSGFENVKSVADADVRRIMNYGHEKRLTSTRFGFSFSFNCLFVCLFVLFGWFG